MFRHAGIATAPSFGACVPQTHRLHTELELLDVYVAAVAAHHAADVLHAISAAAPLPGHIKRVRRLPPPPGAPGQLDVILCAASPAAANGAPDDAADDLLPSACLPGDAREGAEPRASDPDQGPAGHTERRSEDEDWLHGAPPGVAVEVIALVRGLGLQPRRCCVPAHAPGTRAEWEEWRAIWPLHWRPLHKVGVF